MFRDADVRTVDNRFAEGYAAEVRRKIASLMLATWPNAYFADLGLFTLKTA